MSSNFFAAVAVMVALGFAGCAATAQMKEASAAAAAPAGADRPAADDPETRPPG